jgi:hypothetical protein
MGARAPLERAKAHRDGCKLQSQKVDIDSERLKSLVDDLDIDELLNLVSLTDIAQAWCRYETKHEHDLQSATEDPDWWAVDLWNTHEFLKDEDRRREGLLALLEVASTGYILGMIGAGPLEDFITADEDRVRWLEFQAAESPNLREALKSAWIEHTRPRWVIERLERAARGPMVRAVRPPGAGAGRS